MIEASFSTVSIMSLILWIGYRWILYKKSKNLNLVREGILLMALIYFLMLLNLTIFKFGMIRFYNQLAGYKYYKEGIFKVINLIPFIETIKTDVSISI